MALVKQTKDEQGRYILRLLFFELASPEQRQRFDVPFTLKEHDYEYEGVIYTSLRRIYLEMEDPTEYRFAQHVFGSWDHWKTLKSLNAFKEYYKSWSEELSIRLQAKGVARMIEEAQSDSKSSAVAARWLAEKGWQDKQDYKGRPNKRKVIEEAARMREADAELDEFLEHAKTVSH